MAEDLQPDSRRAGYLLDVALGEAAQHGDGGIVPDQTIARKDTRQQLDRVISDRMSPQVVDYERHAGDAGEAFNQTGRLPALQMVQEQRRQREIEAAVFERQVQRVGADDFDFGITRGLPSGFRSHYLIQIQGDAFDLDPAGARPRDDPRRNVSRPRADVEQSNPPKLCSPNSLDHREQMARQRAPSAQVAVNAAQIGQVFDHLGGRVIRAVHQLGFAAALGERSEHSSSLSYA